jgi:sarcosine oxidase subunit gamma
VLPPAARWVLRGDSTVMAAAARTLGVPFVERPCQAAAAAESAALWLGPDERLLIAPANTQGELASRLHTALSAQPHSLVEVSHRQVALEIAGQHAAVLLNSGCPLDLHVSAFPPGMCTRTMFAKTEIVLWRTAEQRFHIEVWRSFAAYLSKYLALAAGELAE